ncbi:unnamed protein product, partial [Phaeothamnion confervicola]
MIVRHAARLIFVLGVFGVFLVWISSDSHHRRRKWEASLSALVDDGQPGWRGLAYAAAIATATPADAATVLRSAAAFRAALADADPGRPVIALVPEPLRTRLKPQLEKLGFAVPRLPTAASVAASAAANAATAAAAVAAPCANSSGCPLYGAGDVDSERFYNNGSRALRAYGGYASGAAAHCDNMDDDRD